MLKFSDIVQIMQGYEMYNDKFKDFQIFENSEEEIKDAAIEMMSRLEGNLKYDNEDEILQNKFHSLFLPTNFCYGTSARAGASFLKKYKHLF